MKSKNGSDNNNSNHSVKPALGDSWTYVPHTQLFLRHSSELIPPSDANILSEAINSRCATVTKSAHSECYQNIQFVIMSKGIVDIPNKASNFDE